EVPANRNPHLTRNRIGTRKGHLSGVMAFNPEYLASEEVQVISALDIGERGGPDPEQASP
ncbi:MAG TPA: hypothetical protein VKJ77_04385, partial [Caballeronia sp.]|nr:hypothetical protein [Caballeronia sp.]